MTKKRINGHHLKSHVKKVYACQMILFSVLIHLIYSNCTRQLWQITFTHPLQGLLGLWCDWRRKHCRFWTGLHNTGKSLPMRKGFSVKRLRGKISIFCCVLEFYTKNRHHTLNCSTLSSFSRSGTSLVPSSRVLRNSTWNSTISGKFPNSTSNWNRQIWMGEINLKFPVLYISVRHTFAFNNYLILSEEGLFLQWV